GRRLAVIVNEFGDVGIDGELLKGCGDAACPEENIVELANGCLCCTVADEFVPALNAILARSPAVEHIVIETSGLALPKPLVQAFQWPAIKSRVSVAGVAAADGKVDPAALLGLGVGTEDDIANRRTHHDLEEEHDHDEFDSFVVALPEIADPGSLAARIAVVAESNHVLRMKGFAAVAGK